MIDNVYSGLTPSDWIVLHTDCVTCMLWLRLYRLSNSGTSLVVNCKSSVVYLNFTFIELPSSRLTVEHGWYSGMADYNSSLSHTYWYTLCCMVYMSANTVGIKEFQCRKYSMFGETYCRNSVWKYKYKMFISLHNLKSNLKPAENLLTLLQWWRNVLHVVSVHHHLWEWLQKHSSTLLTTLNHTMYVNVMCQC